MTAHECEYWINRSPQRPTLHNHATRSLPELFTACSTMENALYGDSMIEKLRSAGTAAEKEKEEIAEKLQQQALALKIEQEDKMKLLASQESVEKAAQEAVREAEERAAKKEAEMAAALAEVEKRRADLETEAASIQAAVNERAQALHSANSEYEKVQAMLAAARAAASASAASSAAAAAPASSASSASATPAAPITVDRAAVASAAGLNLAELEAVERRARQLEDEKLRLEREKMVLERSVRDMAQTTAKLQSDYEGAEAARKHLEAQMADLSNEEGDLAKERQLRKRLERKLQIAEDSLKRLDAALRRTGVKLDVDVFADVKTLLTYFEERCVSYCAAMPTPPSCQAKPWPSPLSFNCNLSPLFDHLQDGGSQA